MSIIDTIQATVSLVSQIASKMPAMAAATAITVARGVAYGISNADVIIKGLFNGAFAALKMGLRVGRAIGVGLYDASKYIVTHIPDILNGLYEVAKFCLKNIIPVTRYLTNKLLSIIKNTPRFLAEVVKSIARSIKAIGQYIYNNGWQGIKNLTNVSIQLSANIVGVAIGIVYTPFYILSNQLRRTDQGEPTTPSREEAIRRIEEFRFEEPASSYTPGFASVNESNAVNSTVGSHLDPYHSDSESELETDQYLSEDEDQAINPAFTTESGTMPARL